MNILDAPLYVHTLIILCIFLLGSIGAMCFYIANLKEQNEHLENTIAQNQTRIDELKRRLETFRVIVDGYRADSPRPMPKAEEQAAFQLPIPQRDSDRMQCAECGATGNTDSIMRGECCDQEYEPGTGSKTKEPAIEEKSDAEL